MVIENFKQLTLNPKLLESLQRLQFTEPTPIQAQAIPLVMEGKDVMAIAQTGTGKTMAFGLPMLHRLGKSKGQGLIVLPTRELAIQVEESLLKIAGHLGLRTALLIGGAPAFQQKKQLRNRPNILIATPGRLIDHLEQKNLTLKNVQILVLDEADRMLDMGFAPQIKQIIKAVPTERQTLLFSATMPRELLQIANATMHAPYHIEVAPSGTTAENIEQAFMVMHKEDKFKELATLLKQFNGTVLVFTRTKHGASKLTRQLKDSGLHVAEIHSNRSLGQRRMALEGFKSGRYRILVATDIAARGIDVKEIGMVLNFDLPNNPEDYVHRIGRTGRAGKEGLAISFATPDQKRDVEGIERLIRQSLKVHFRVPFQAAASRRSTGSRRRSYVSHSHNASRGHTRGGYRRTRFKR